MADISLSMVKELRERTHAGMSACKEALGEANGDLDKAVEILMKKGTIKAADRAGKVATEGEVRAWVSPDKKRGVVVEVNSQTDFVSRGDQFKSFVGQVLEVASTLKKGDDLTTAKLGDKTVDDVRIGRCRGDWRKHRCSSLGFRRSGLRHFVRPHGRQDWRARRGRPAQRRCGEECRLH